MALSVQKARFGAFVATGVLFLSFGSIVLSPPVAALATTSVTDNAPVAAWTASPAVMGGSYVNKTVRNIAHIGVGGDKVQIRLTNVYGTIPVTFDSVYLGRQSTDSAVAAGTNTRVQFSGLNSVTIPIGGVVLSDPVNMSVNADDNLAVSVHLSSDTGEISGHSQVTQSAWVADGDATASESPGPYASSIQYHYWFWLDAVIVRPNVPTTGVVALGDSITEGYMSTINTNRRYPDLLGLRARASNIPVSIVNAGIGGNQILHNAGGVHGPSLQARLASDVLSLPNVRTVIFLAGVNDINSGGATSASQLIQADKLIINRLHASGIRVIGGTLLPIAGEAGYGSPFETIRSDLNSWIRTGGAFDGVVDFDLAMQDPANPLRLLPAYDSGDHLHPNDAGYQAMANSVPLGLLTASSPAVTPACVATQTSTVAPVDLTDSAAAYSSSSSRSNQEAAFAFDNNPATNWQGANDNFPNEFLAVDFGRAVTIESVTISEFNHRTRGFRIDYYSGGTWSPAHTSAPGFVGFGDQSAPTTISFTPVTGTKVRIAYLSGTEYSPVVYEMLVTGSSDLTIGATASSPQTPRPGQDPSKAIDKSNATNWQPVDGSLDGTSLVVDWGAQRVFNRVTVSEYGNRSANYRLQTTSDGMTWADICSGTGGFGATSSTTTLLSFDAASGRALRLVFDHVAAYSPIIYELKAYPATIAP